MGGDELCEVLRSSRHGAIVSESQLDTTCFTDVKELMVCDVTIRLTRSARKKCVYKFGPADNLTVRVVRGHISSRFLISFLND